MVLFVALACVGCTSPNNGKGASLPDYSPDGGPNCGSGAVDVRTCPTGSFCMQEAFTGGRVCKRVPTACASSPTCECLVGQAAYDCPRDLWACEANDAGVATSMGCVAN
jgi:hypothetical protein